MDTQWSLDLNVATSVGTSILSMGASMPFESWASVLLSCQ